MKSWDDMKRMKQDDRMRRYPLESIACYLFNRCSTGILEAKIIPPIRQMIRQIDFLVAVEVASEDFRVI